MLSYFAYELKKAIDERGEGETFTLSKGQRFILNLFLLVSLALDLFYAQFTPLMN